MANAELTGGFSAITEAKQLVIAEVLPVERLVPKALRAEEPNGRPGTGQLGIPAVRSAAGIGIGRGLTASPLPHHLAYGSRTAAVR